MVQSGRSCGREAWSSKTKARSAVAFGLARATSRRMQAGPDRGDIANGRAAGKAAPTALYAGQVARLDWVQSFQIRPCTPIVRRNSAWSPALLVIVWSLIGIAAAVTAVTLAGFNVDLAIASLFYDPISRQFSGLHAPSIAKLRDHGLVAIITCIGCIALAAAKYLPGRWPSIPNRTAVFLTFSLLLGPGLLVNGILKEHWGRPRPIAVTQFGGTQPYVDWW